MNQTSNKETVKPIRIRWTFSKTYTLTAHVGVVGEINGEAASDLLQAVMGTDAVKDTEGDLVPICATVEILNQELVKEYNSVRDWMPTHRCFKTQAGKWQVVKSTDEVLSLNHEKQDYLISNRDVLPSST